MTKMDLAGLNSKWMIWKLLVSTKINKTITDNYTPDIQTILK